MAKHHDSGYKELFSHPEFVQQLIEGFTPPEIAALAWKWFLAMRPQPTTAMRILRWV